MIARGFIKGTGPISQRMFQLVRKTTAPLGHDSREALEQHADDLWARHESAMKGRPVS